MSTELQYLTFLTLLALFATNAIARRRRGVVFRPLGAVQALPRMAGESIESSRPLHLVLGGVGIGGSNTLLALAGADFLYESARLVAIGDAPPIISVSDPSALSLGREILRRAYHNNATVGTPFTLANLRWIPTGAAGLGLAAATMAIQHDDSIGGQVFVGTFGTELALMLLTSQRRQHTSIAHSTAISGQAVAYALADHTLIGEEIFGVNGYLDKTLLNRNVVLDVARFVLALALLVVFVASLARGL